jgi:hypothetical protein
MKLARSELKEDAIVTPYIGNGALGAVYGTPRSEKLLVEPGFKKITNQQGQEVIASAFCLAAADSTLKTNDQVCVNGIRYDVIDAQSIRVSGRTHHVEIYLKGTGVDS